MSVVPASKARWVAVAVLGACGQPTTRPVDPVVASGSSVAASSARTPSGRVDFDAGKNAPDTEGMLMLIDEYRRAAGVAPVRLDPSLTKGCQEHARYMVLNRGKPQLYSINAHHQDPNLPGATPEGAECGKRAVLYPSVNDLRDAVHRWMATIYHRAPIIAPNIAAVGIGASPLPTSMKRLAVALRFVYDSADGDGWPIAYPADGQVDVPVDFQGEAPTPIPPGGSATPGYPFTLQFPTYDPLTGISGALVDEGGNEVPVYFSSPEKPASKYNSQLGLVGIIPQQTLRAGARYTATVTATWKGRKQTWTSSFTTMQRIQIDDASNEAALLAAVGKPARVRGVVKSTGRVSGQVMIKLHGPPVGSHILNVQVTAPKQTVAKVASLHPQTHSFYELVGKTIELDATPQIMFRTLRLDVPPTGVFRVVR